MKRLPTVNDHPDILTITDKNFDQLSKDKVMLVDFWADWCAPCKMMAPVLNDVAAELTDNAKVAKLNIEQYQSMAQRFNVRSIPTLILFKNGKELKRYVGVKQKNFLVNEIKAVS